MTGDGPCGQVWVAVMRWAGLLVLGLVLAAPEAQAAKRCAEPYPPVIKPDPAVSKAQLAAVRDDVAAFMAASDIYQKCLIETKDVTGRVQMNQSVKERVGREFNALVRTAGGGKS
jgi:hypothetical protein